VIELAALLRLIPYVLVIVIAYQKGFRWLTMGAAFVASTASDEGRIGEHVCFPFVDACLRLKAKEIICEHRPQMSSH
jgi:hypothetical protein